MMQRTFETNQAAAAATAVVAAQDQLGHEFYNDDLYDYNEHFMRDEENEMCDDGEEDGPLAFGNQLTKTATTQDECITENDLLMMDTFFKKVDSLELVKPKRAKVIQDKYLMGELLGDGSYGKVKECLDLSTLSRRAVKIINLKNVQRKIPRGVQNVRKEICIMRRLTHKNVIKLYDVFEKNMCKSGEEAMVASDEPFSESTNIEKPPKLYIFMDYCMTSLEKLLKTAPNNGRLSNRQANFYFKQLIDGLEYLHSLGIIHNDIKPGNLLIQCDETLKICDFSISAQLKLFMDYDMDNFDADYYDILNENENKNQFPIIQCTPMFQCPEMLAENLDEKSIIYNACKIDVWSSGITLYQVTTGELPFRGQTIHQIYESIRSTLYEIKVPSFVDKHLINLLNGMLNRDPKERWSIKQIRDSEWFKRKHPYIADEYAQWPLDVVQNETGTYRMLSYLEKYCDELQHTDQNTTTTQSQILQQNTSTSKQKLADASPTYPKSAIKLKKNNCIIN